MFFFPRPTVLTHFKNLPCPLHSQLGLKSSKLGLKSSQMGLKSSQLGLKYSQLGLKFSQFGQAQPSQPS